jgi:hypothetical protein
MKMHDEHALYAILHHVRFVRFSLHSKPKDARSPVSLLSKWRMFEQKYARLDRHSQAACRFEYGYL